MLLVALLSLAAADPQVWDGGRPACAAVRLHEFWPAEANTDPLSLAREARCGRLEICTRRGWRYSWQKMTLRVGNRLPAICAPSEADRRKPADVQEPVRLEEDGR